MIGEIKLNYVDRGNHLNGVLMGSLLFNKTMDISPELKSNGMARGTAEDHVKRDIEYAIFNWVLGHCPGMMNGYYQRRRSEEYHRTGR